MTVIHLTQFDNGRTIEIRQGDEVILELPENRTTGYCWKIDRHDGFILKQEEHKIDTNEDQPDPERLIGHGGFVEFRFLFINPIQGRLELKYWQEWEGESSATKPFVAEFLPIS